MSARGGSQQKFGPLFPLCCAALVFLNTSCSIAPTNGAPSRFDVEIKNAPIVHFDDELKRYSSSLHRYLMGLIADGDEDSAAAIREYEQANELLQTPEPALHLRLAVLYLQVGELEKSLAQIERTLARDPESLEALVLRAGLLDVTGRDVEAAEQYRNLVKKEPGEVENYLLLASIYAEIDNREKANSLLKDAARRFPKSFAPHYYLGLSYRDASQLKEASGALKRAHDLSPENLDVVIALIEVALLQGDVRYASKIVERISARNSEDGDASFKKLHDFLAANPQRALQFIRARRLEEVAGNDMRYNLALGKIEEQEYKSATRELALVLAQRPKFAEARYYFASVLAAMGKKHEGVRELLRIPVGDELFLKSRTFAAFISRQIGDFDSAARAVREAIEVEGENDRLLNYLISILREAGKFEEAEELIREALKRSPKDDRLLFTYGIVLGDLRRDLEALTIMEQVILLNPQHADALNYVAYSLAERGEQLPRALDLIQRALVLRPADGYYLDTLGWIYYGSGEYLQAEEVLHKAVEITGRDFVILEHYADCLEKLGKKLEAVETYRLALLLVKGAERVEEGSAEKRIEKKLSRLLEPRPNTQPVISAGK